VKLSVILLCFNGSATLAVQLEALTRQQWRDGWEVVAVDNGSTDDSVDIVRRYQDLLPDLKIIQAYTPGTPRLGVSHSYNTGIQAATGDAFVFCEADDEVAPGWLQAMGEALADHPFVIARRELSRLNPSWLHPLSSEGEQYSGLLQRETEPFLQWGDGTSFGLQRSMYTALGPLSIEFPMSCDTEYCWRAQAAGYALYLEPRAVVHYRERTRLKDRFAQGRNWGCDYTLVERHYGLGREQFALLRQNVYLLRMLPGGFGAAVLAATGRRQARCRLANWVWNFGWAVGKRNALISEKVSKTQNGRGATYPNAGIKGGFRQD